MTDCGEIHGVFSGNRSVNVQKRCCRVRDTLQRVHVDVGGHDFPPPPEIQPHHHRAVASRKDIVRYALTVAKPMV